jgi:hypothetical protein
MAKMVSVQYGAARHVTRRNASVGAGSPLTSHGPVPGMLHALPATALPATRLPTMQHNETPTTTQQHSNQLDEVAEPTSGKHTRHLKTPTTLVMHLLNITVLIAWPNWALEHHSLVAAVSQYWEVVSCHRSSRRPCRKTTEFPNPCTQMRLQAGSGRTHTRR